MNNSRLQICNSISLALIWGILKICCQSVVTSIMFTHFARADGISDFILINQLHMAFVEAFWISIIKSSHSILRLCVSWCLSPVLYLTWYCLYISVLTCQLLIWSLYIYTTVNYILFWLYFFWLQMIRHIFLWVKGSVMTRLCGWVVSHNYSIRC